MLLGSLLTIIVGALYILFAFVEPPEAIATFFRVPVLAVFFPPEKRMKYGRLTIGVLLILAGPLLSLIPARGLQGGARVVGIVILGILVAAKWKRAGEVGEADDAQRRVERQSFEMLKRDTRFLHLHQYLHARHYRTTLERVPDPLAYRILYIDLWDANWQRLLAHHGAAARWLVAYLERSAEPRRLKVTLDIQTGTCAEHEVGWMGWGGLVPRDPLSA